MFQNPADGSCADRVLGSSAARRRRERRLRSMLRNARMTVAMALAEFSHLFEGDRGWPGPGCGGTCRTTRRRSGSLPHPSRSSSASKKSPAGACRQEKVLDLPVPQMVDYVADALRILDFPLAEQVIEVPKISCSPCPSRSLVPEPQSAEQLVEVPTVLSPLRIAEQIVGTPAPHGRGQGSLPGQGSPASGKRISERIVEQIVDFPHQTVEQIVDSSPGDGCELGSSSSAGPADEDFTGGFSHFSHGKKCGVPGRW